MCTGYMYIKSSERLIALYDCLSKEGKRKYESCALINNDQTYFNNYVKRRCMMCPLPLSLYPNGKMFYNNHERISSTAILIHFNWVKGHDKMLKMREHKKWHIEE
jgi:hypothetical protein